MNLKTIAVVFGAFAFTGFFLGAIFVSLLPPEWYKSIWDFLDKNFVLPIGVALLTYWATTYISEAKSRKNYSRLGVAIVESLMEEVRSGINTMKDLKKFLIDSAVSKTDLFPRLLPTKSWEGPQTIPNDVLLRILAISNGVQAPFPPNEVRIHCKNYFSHICENINQLVKNNDRDRLKHYLGPGKYIESSEKVLEMLETIKNILQKNSEKFFPK